MSDPGARAESGAGMSRPEMPRPEEAADREAKLGAILEAMGSVLVAYSGGVDSAFLLKAAHQRLGDRAVGLIAVSPSLPKAELEDARRVATEIGCRLELAQAHEHERPEYVANSPARCYFCKTELFDICESAARRLGLAWVAYGANLDDTGDIRPGMQAARERRIRAPLLEAGLSKADIRTLARRAGLSVWDKPAFACLASRIPHGIPVTVDRLARIEAAEEVLRGRGFRQFRVRDLDGTARVEVLPEDVARLSGDPVRAQVTAGLKALGFRAVLIDPEGYRSGKLNGEPEPPGFRRPPESAAGPESQGNRPSS